HGRHALIADDVAGRARRDPDGLAAVAVDSAGRAATLTWAPLWERAGRAAAAAAPSPPPNRLEFLTLPLGALRIGAACEPLMPIFRERELRFMLAESAAPVLVVPREFRGHDHGGVAHELIGELEVLRHLLVVH